MQSIHTKAWVVAAVVGLSSWTVGAQPHAAGAAPHGGKAPSAHPHGMPPGQAKRLGAGPQHKWVKGSHVPLQYRSGQYVLHHWQAHGLKSPPKGYQWVQYDADYLLVSIATGVIAQLILGH